MCDIVGTILGAVVALGIVLFIVREALKKEPEPIEHRPPRSLDEALRRL